MRKETITYEIFKFDELSDKAKEKALENHRYINVEFDGFWFEHIEQELKEYDVKLTEFDTYRGTIKLDIEDATKFAEGILKDHSKDCETYETALRFLNDFIDEGSFRVEISEDYLKLLRDCYYWNTSDEGVTETLIANNYEFLKDGEDY